MRYDAPFLVKRLAPMFGRPDSPPRVTVAHQAYRLEWAVAWAADEHERHEKHRSTNPVRAAEGRLWIERRGQAATRPRAA